MSMGGARQPGERKFDRSAVLSRRDTLKRGILAAGGITIGVPLFSGQTVATHGSGDRFERTDDRYDLSGIVFFNPCTEEDIEITSGTQYVTFFLRIDDEDLVLKYHVWLSGVKAVGLDSGGTYRLTSNFNSFLVLSLAEDSFPLTTTIRFLGRTISTSNDEDWETVLLLHTTINANGEVTVDLTEGYIDTCIGD